jgi:pimeloyl-ACP methyl ester carboxylesterase
MRHLIVIMFMGLWLAPYLAHSAYTSSSKPLTTEQGQLNYHQLGSGKQTVLLLGGGPGFSSWNLEPIQQILAPHYRVLLMDMRGIGENKQAVDPNEKLLKQWVQDLEQLRQYSGSESWTLIGHSWGALMAQLYAEQYPKRIEQLILLNPVDPQTDSLKTLVERIEQKRLANTPIPDPFDESAWQQKIETSDTQKLTQRQLNQALPSYFYRYQQGVDYAEQFSTQDFELPINLGIWQAYQQQPIRPQALKQLSLQFPLFIIGCEDDLLSPENIANYRKILPNIPHKQLPQCSHFPWVEQPKAFEQQLLAYLREEAEFTPLQRAQWFDASGLFDSQAAQSVNSGELTFVEANKIDTRFDYHMSNRIDFLPNSLTDGWLSLQQCHFNLDAVKALEIVYAADKTRKLTIVSQKHIGHAKVEGNSLQLTNIKGSAQICVSAQTRGLERISAQQWQLKRGPFMRRYLDGYYPMQVSLEVDWRQQPIQLSQSQPIAQKGVVIEQTNQQFKGIYQFEGKLHPQLTFELAK